MHLTEDQPFRPQEPSPPEGSDLSEIRQRLEGDLPLWSAEGTGTGENTNEGRLARVELKDAIESLIDPKFRFNIAGRNFLNAGDQTKELEADVLQFFGDVLRLLVRRINAWFDQVILSQPVRLLWAQLMRRQNVAESLQKKIPFMVREAVLVRPDGTVAVNVKRLSGDTKLSELLAAGGNTKGPRTRKTRRAERKAASKTFSKLALVADANKSALQTVVYSNGSRFALAASVQGIVPRGFLPRLSLTVKAIEEDLKDGSKAASKLTATKSRRVRRYLKEILDIEPRRLEMPHPWLQSFGIASIVLVALFIANGTLNSWKEARWHQMIVEIDSIPGIDVTNSTTNTKPRIITGFRDPLAADPLALIEKNGFAPRDVALSFFPYRSSDPPIVEQRAQSLLQPPDSVELLLSNGTLFVTGSAPHSWLKHCENQRPYLLPQTQLDLGGVIDITLLDCRSVAEQLVSERIDFDPTEDATIIARESEFDRIARLIQTLQQKAYEARVSLEIRLIGRHQDSSDSIDVQNLEIGRARADYVHDLLLTRDPIIDAIVLRSFADRPLANDALDAKRRNHAVEFSVKLNGETLNPGAVVEISDTGPKPVSRLTN